MSGQTDNHDPVLVGGALVREMGLRAVVAEDFQTHGRDFWAPGFQAILTYRLGIWSRILGRPFRWPVTLLYLIGFQICRAVYGIELRRSVRIGRRFLIGHQHGIVIHRFATFGNDCIIRQGVTLGIANEERWQRGVGPVIGNNVSFSPGCVIIGNIKIGDNVQIGPNCVVTSDVPANRTLFVPPPRVLPREIQPERDSPPLQTEKEDMT